MRRILFVFFLVWAGAAAAWGEGVVRFCRDLALRHAGVSEVAGETLAGHAQRGRHTSLWAARGR